MSCGSIEQQQVASVSAASSINNGNDSKETNGDHKNVDLNAILSAQISAYKMLARSEPIPRRILNQATLLQKRDDILPVPYEHPLELSDGEILPYDLNQILAIHQRRVTTRTTSLTIPTGIDPELILKERENRIQNRIGQRIIELVETPMNISANLRMAAEIELRALRLLNLQTQVRSEVLGYLKRETTLETALNPYAYRRTKRHTLREARVTEKLEKQQKLEQDKRKRQKHTELLQAILQASKDFKEFHKNVQLKVAKIKKAVLTYHANNEKEIKKTQQKNEKERMMKLIEEDDVGYRQLLDEKKDKRLVFLLQQTDEYVESLTGLVKQHQITEKKRKKDERRETKKALKLQQPEGEELHLIVRNSVTGEILKGENAPKAEELEEWLEKNSGYEVISRDAASDSEEDSEQEQEKQEIEETKEDEFEGLDEEQRNKRIIEKARNEEDEYDQRTKAQMESYYATAHKIKERVVAQPTLMGGEDPSLKLKPYQIKGLEWMVSLYNNNLNGILADEMGLGKTIQTISLISYLMEVKKVNGPYLIIVPLSTVSNWKLELDKWAPTVVKIVYKGDKESRKKLEKPIKQGNFNVLLTTYDYVLKEKSLLGKIRWKYMIIDEGHRMKNHNCKLTLTLNAYFSAQHRLLLTGTPLQNKLPELWALLNFLLPTIFSSCGTFEQWFNAPFATTGEKVELTHEETMLIIRRLHKVLRPFLLRRLKKDVESQLPEKVEYVIKCEMSELQRVLYKHLQQKGLLIDSKFQGGRALMNTVVHLRKLCNHPFLFPNVEDECFAYWGREATGRDLYRVAGKFELLDRILPKLKATGHRILIFCQMTQLMTIMEDFFKFRCWKYLRLDGSTKHEDRGNLLKEFNAPNSDYFIFMLSTRAGGLGLNLQTADTVVLFDSDWNPHQDMQAQDRAHRIGQTREVRVLRLITVNSVEEKILACARYKLNVDEKVIQAGKFDQKSTWSERRNILEQIIGAENEENDENEAPDEDEINKMIARSDDEYDMFEKIDIDRRRAEAAEYNRKPRLIEYSELPPTIVNEVKRFAEAEEAADLAAESPALTKIQPAELGRRKRKEVDYSQDLMSDREWLKQMDEAIEDDDEDQPQRKKSRKYEPGFEGTKRGRKPRAKHDEQDDSDGDEKSDKRKNNAELSKDFLKLILKLKETKTSDGKYIADPFVKLPTKKEMPEYYEVIEKPVDINRIEKKIKSNRYSSIKQLTGDVVLMCRNAQRYNIEASEIHEDSKLLEIIWSEKIVVEYENELKSKPSLKTSSSKSSLRSIIEDETEKPSSSSGSGITIEIGPPPVKSNEEKRSPADENTMNNMDGEDMPMEDTLDLVDSANNEESSHKESQKKTSTMPLGIFGGSTNNSLKPQPLPSEKIKKDKRSASNFHNDAKGSTIKLGKKSYTVEKKLAEGGFAIVYLVIDKRGRYYALKRQLIRDDPRQVEACKTEIQVVKNLNGHKNIIAYVDHQLSVNKAGVYDYMLLTSYYPTNVLQMMNSRLLANRWLANNDILDIFCDVCEAVARLHHSKTPVIHRDLKVENVLIDKRSGSEKPVYVLCDYGSATTKVLSRETCGHDFIEEEIQRYTTLSYRAPEMIDLFLDVLIDTKSDIWALGVMLYKLCYFSLPFGESALAIQSGLFSFPDAPAVSDEIKAIINLCLTHSARHRPNIYQISYLAFSAAGRKCPIYNIEKSSRIEVSEAVQILQLRSRLGTNYAKAFERAINDFEETKQKRDAQGRAQLIASKLLSSSSLKEKRIEKQFEADTNINVSTTIVSSMKTPNSHFTNKLSADEVVALDEGLIVSTDIFLEVEKNQLRTGSTSVNPRLRPKPATSGPTSTPILSATSLVSSTPTSYQPQQLHKMPISYDKSQHHFKSPILDTPDLGLKFENKKFGLKKLSTPTKIMSSNLPSTSDAPSQSYSVLKNSPTIQGIDQTNVTSNPNFIDPSLIHQNKSSRKHQAFSPTEIAKKYDIQESSAGPRLSAFQPYTLANKQQRDFIVDALHQRQSEPGTSSNNPFVSTISDDDPDFGEFFDELARRYQRSQSIIDSIHPAKDCFDLHHRNASLSCTSCGENKSGLALVKPSKDTCLTTSDLCLENCYESQAILPVPLSLRLARRAAEVSKSDLKTNTADNEDFWRRTQSSELHRLTPIGRNGNPLTNEEFERIVEEDPFGSAPSPSSKNVL